MRMFAPNAAMQAGPYVSAPLQVYNPSSIPPYYLTAIDYLAQPTEEAAQLRQYLRIGVENYNMGMIASVLSHAFTATGVSLEQVNADNSVGNRLRLEPFTFGFDTERQAGFSALQSLSANAARLVNRAYPQQPVIRLLVPEEDIIAKILGSVPLEPNIDFEIDWEMPEAVG
jgi:hypothetical protein